MKEEFVDARRMGFLKIKEAKDAGHKICGAFCQYTPAEIIMAAGYAQVPLCGRSPMPIKTAETQLPANLCPLIKASYGHVLEDSCPFAHFSDVVVGETTCDGKKKMYELLSEKKDMIVIHLPNIPDRERSLEAWEMELRSFTKQLSERSNIEITDDLLNECIHKSNLERIQAAHIYELGRYEPPALSGTDMQSVLDGVTFMFDWQERYDKVQGILDDCEARYAAGERPVPKDPYRPRIIYSGAGWAGVAEKTINVTEELGGSVVCFEGCCGISSRRRLISEDTSIDPYRRIAEKYLDVPCAVVSPNTRRFDQVRDTIDEWNADGIISVTLHSCNPFAIETENIRRTALEKGIPLLHIDTDFYPGDAGQIRTRIQAFLEMIRAKKEEQIHE